MSIFERSNTIIKVLEQRARARARIIFEAILGLLLVGVVISANSWGFAQGGSVSGSVKDLSNNQGIQGVIITVKDVSNSAVTGTGNTDAEGNYSVSIPSLGNYTIQASKLGYYNLTSGAALTAAESQKEKS